MLLVRNKFCSAAVSFSDVHANHLHICVAFPVTVLLVCKDMLILGTPRETHRSFSCS